MPPRLSNTRLRAPVNVTWEVTLACNLQCTHCLSADLMSRGVDGGDASEPVWGEASRGRELDLCQCRDVIDQLADMEVFQINFGGGEPFLRDDILDILSHCQAQGITTCVSTNGTLLTSSLVSELLDMAPVYLQVSLDGARAQTNDAIRGPGTFARIMAGVELLAERDYPGFSLNMVVTRLNAGEIGDFDRLAHRCGAKTRLSRFRPSGAGRDCWEDYRLTREQLLAVSRFLGDHPEILTGDSFFALTPESRLNLGLDRCGAAKMTCAIVPDGGVYPCAFLCHPDFYAGNVTTEPFSDMFSCSPVLEQFRELEVDSCRVCDRFSVCHGGCPAVAFFLTHSLDQPDPECLRALTVEESVARVVRTTKEVA